MRLLRCVPRLLPLLLVATACTDPEARRVRERPGTCVPVQAVKANGIDVEYDIRGPADGTPLLLVMGLGMQLTFWGDGFLQRLVDEGFRVIRFDNRDVGRSTHFAALGKPDVLGTALAARAGWEVRTPYTLGDLADDTAGLLDALRVPSAFVLGVSMGGMVAQELALKHPSKVRGLVSVMSTTGARDLPDPRRDALDVLFKVPGPSREENVAHGVKMFGVLAGPGYPADRDELANRFGVAWDRCWDPDGVARQTAAVLGQRDRTQALAALKVPALVVHGTDDPLVPFPHGEATARAIPGARFLPIEGMGHDLPKGAWVKVAEATRQLAGL